MGLPFQPAAEDRSASGPLTPSAGSSPEDVFIAWLLHLPPDADVAQAARMELRRLEPAAARSPKLARLSELMRQAAANPSPRHTKANTERS